MASREPHVDEAMHQEKRQDRRGQAEHLANGDAGIAVEVGEHAAHPCQPGRENARLG